MAPALGERPKRALRYYRDSLRRIDLPAAQAGMDINSGEALQAWLPGAQRALESGLRKAQRELAVAEAKIAAAPRAGASQGEASWKALDDACRILEQELVRPSNLRSRLDEGRRSMMPKVESMVQDRLEPDIKVRGNRLVATLDDDGIRALQEELPHWVRAWGQFVLDWLELDLERLVQRLWSPRDGDLPIQPPVFKRFKPPRVEGAPAVPRVELGRDQSSLGSGMFRHGRSILYGLLSLTFLGARFGCNSSSSAEQASGDDSGVGTVLLLILGFVLAVGFGYVQAQGERRKEREKLALDARRKEEQAVRDMLRVWLDRSQDKLAESVTHQLLERRQEMVHWYREEVVPARERLRQENARRAAAAEEARRALPLARDRARDLERAREALGKLDAELRG